MTRNGLETKLKKLEKRKNKNAVRIACLTYIVDVNGTPINPDVAAWLSSPNPNLNNAPESWIGPYRGLLNRKIIVIPQYESDEAWEAAAMKCYRELTSSA